LGSDFFFELLVWQTPGDAPQVQAMAYVGASQTPASSRAPLAAAMTAASGKGQFRRKYTQEGKEESKQGSSQASKQASTHAIFRPVIEWLIFFSRRTT
jgi:hypothetical protein